MFRQIEQVVKAGAVTLELPEGLPQDLVGKRLYLRMPFTFMLDQPALLAFLGLSK
jgi:hypothetical protein